MNEWNQVVPEVATGLWGINEAEEIIIKKAGERLTSAHCNVSVQAALPAVF